jgi:hypothetical protein
MPELTFDCLNNDIYTPVSFVSAVVTLMSYITPYTKKRTNLDVEALAHASYHLTRIKRQRDNPNSNFYSTRLLEQAKAHCTHVEKLHHKSI